MSKFLDKIYKNYVWLVIIFSLVGYFAYRVMSFNGMLMATLTDPQTYIQLMFVIFLNVNMVSAAFDSGVSTGLTSEEFELADELNNKIITSVNNEMADFRDYIRKLNEHEKIMIEEDFFFKVGDKKLEDLTKQELKEYNALQPIRHNIYGFNLPLYYEMTKSGEITYKASIQQNQGKRKAQVKKIFTGAMFGAMTINMLFSVENVGTAFISLMVITVGLIITFLMSFVPQIFKFKYAIPKKVILKNTLFKSYIAHKNGTHVLKEVNIEKKIIDSNIGVIANSVPAEV